MEQFCRIFNDTEYVDVSTFFGGIQTWYYNICGPKGSGKSTLLSVLRCYYDDLLDAGSAFKNCEYGQDFPEHREMNKHPILFLDFSDFDFSTMDGAYGYFRYKMSSLYQSMIDRCKDSIRYYSDYERYLNIIEGACGECELAGSLRNLVFCAGRGTGERKRPLILIDEAGLPILYAAKFNYLDEMRSFYDAYLDIDHYEQSYSIVTTSYAPPNTDVSYSLKYLRDTPVNEFEPLIKVCERNGIALEKSQKRNGYWDRGYFNRTVSLKECFDEMVGNPDYKPGNHQVSVELSPPWIKLVSEKRKWIEEEKQKAARAERLRQERERREYAAPLSEECSIPSAFAGTRELSLSITDYSRYDELNRLLVTLYEIYGQNITLRNVYDTIQAVKKERLSLDCDMAELQHYAEKSGKAQYAVVNEDEYWVRFDLKRLEEEPGFDDLALVKTYLSVRDDRMIGVLFHDVVKYLINQGLHRFHAKISKRKRADHICLWIAREDFFLLEKHLYPVMDELTKPLAFVPYRGKLGVSREFWSWDSHNGVQAGLISCYLRAIEEKSQISLEEMYALYVKAWNGDLPDDHPFSKEFISSNAQEFLILLESINVILGNASVSDDHVLLNGDSNLWHALGKSKNWYELGQNCLKDVSDF